MWHYAVTIHRTIKIWDIQIVINFHAFDNDLIGLNCVGLAGSKKSQCTLCLIKLIKLPFKSNLNQVFSVLFIL